MIKYYNIFSIKHEPFRHLTLRIIKIFFLINKKNLENIWSIQKKAVPLHDFSRIGLPSSATKGTDDGVFHANVDD